MKKLLALIALFGSLVLAQAASVTLAWDPNPEPDLAGYIIYFRTNGASYAPARSVTVTNGTTGTVSNLLYGVQYWFVATAFNTSGLESDYSNEVTALIPAKPQPPSNLRTNKIVLTAVLLKSDRPGQPWTVLRNYDEVILDATNTQAFFKTELAASLWKDPNAPPGREITPEEWQELWQNATFPTIPPIPSRDVQWHD